MKVLFAVNNEKISEAIIRKYQAMYKEIISWKNVYYFNAIIRELQRDKTYDRIIIGEDLESYTNNNYEVIDNFLFDKLDSITDEATKSNGSDIPIIFIATERRAKGNPLMTKLFGIGIYNVLIGSDRSYENVCKLIEKPRTKKEAKIYYGIDSEDMEDYQSASSDSVPEEEMANIIKHYRKLGKDEALYIKSFDEIAAQYTDTQLKIIAAKLPLNVKAVLEEKSEKYQQVMIGSVKNQIKKKENASITTRNINSSKNANRIGLINEQLERAKLTKPVVIPSAVNLDKVEKVYKKSNKMPELDEMPQNNEVKVPQTIVTQEPEMPAMEEYNVKEETNTVEAPKRGRGRPKKVQPEVVEQLEVETPKRGRGRPKKITEEPISIQPEQEKVESYIEEEPINLFDMADEEPEKVTDTNELPDLFNMQEENVIEEPKVEPKIQTTMPELPREEEYKPEIQNEPTSSTNYNNNVVNSLQATAVQNNIDVTSLIAQNQKIVSFVGTSKNGTSFIVNNLATLLSQRGIKTALLDLTKNKNSFYIYNMNDESLRKKAVRCAENLRNGIAEGIPVNKNLSVFTGVPNEESNFDDYSNILSTLLKEYSLILLDCDFETNMNYFANSSELYLVQTYDILTIQPLTAFLNELKYKGILREDKLRIVINKALKLKKLNDSMIIGGVSCYNDPASTYQNVLFDRELIRYISIPFEEQTYAKYLERLVDCEISLNGYSKYFLDALSRLADMVYPLIANNNYKSRAGSYNNYNNNVKRTGFRNMDDTLNKMRQNY